MSVILKLAIPKYKKYSSHLLFININIAVAKGYGYKYRPDLITLCSTHASGTLV